MTDRSQFESGYAIPTQPEMFGKPPGKEADLKETPVDEQVPTEDGGYQKYKAAGKLEGKKAIITGGDSGIGRAVAILFAMEGADSFIAYLQEEEEDAQETKRRVEAHGRKCYLMATDIRSKDNCKKVVDEALSKMGGINILINNAATQMTTNSILDLPEEQWENTFQTNIHPYYYMAKYCLPHFKSGDTIINNASVNAYVGRSDLLDYTTTKGAVVSFTYALSNQFVAKGIRVNAVAPGPVYAPLVPMSMNKELQQQFSAPMGRPGQPSEIGTCFVFLASTDSSQLSGQVLHANGGVIVHG